MNKIFKAGLPFMLMFSFVYSPLLMAHGGVANIGNLCRLTIGPFEMNFTGYQPEAAKGEEFCDDIREVGKSIVVLDFIDKALRDFEVEVRVLTDSNNIGIEANAENIGDHAEIEQNTIFHIEPKIYPSGTIVIKNDYPEKAWYIGVVTARNQNDNKTYISVFPFSVGFFDYKFYLPYLTWAIPVVVILIFLGWRLCRKKDVSETA